MLGWFIDKKVALADGRVILSSNPVPKAGTAIQETFEKFLKKDWFPPSSLLLFRR